MQQLPQITQVVLEEEPALPMELAGWGVLIVSILLTVVWLAYLYR
ncbi:hypothetical protein RBH26_01865 [Natronolimnohabitans sp. A-GB9]|nr:hypothetical protein [Natronolimnohabitans sp. A-GB9]MDQ2049221.1 hypothetical protein [Natronolimnohabitans sp. A-GB9]